MAQMAVSFLGKQFDIQYDDSLEGTLLHDLSTMYGYQATIGEEANPQTESHFVAEKVVADILQRLKIMKADAAATAAKAAAVEAIDVVFDKTTVKEKAV